MSQLITPTEDRERSEQWARRIPQVDNLQADLRLVLCAIDYKTRTSDVRAYRLPGEKSYEKLRTTLAGLGWQVNQHTGYDCGCTMSYGCTHGDNEGIPYEYYTVSW